jgi:hypothetical protein
MCVSRARSRLVHGKILLLLLMLLLLLLLLSMKMVMIRWVLRIHIYVRMLRRLCAILM